MPTCTEPRIIIWWTHEGRQYGPGIEPVTLEELSDTGPVLSLSPRCRVPLGSMMCLTTSASEYIYFMIVTDVQREATRQRITCTTDATNLSGLRALQEVIQFFRDI